MKILDCRNPNEVSPYISENEFTAEVVAKYEYTDIEVNASPYAKYHYEEVVKSVTVYRFEDRFVIGEYENYNDTLYLFRPYKTERGYKKFLERHYKLAV